MTAKITDKQRRDWLMRKDTEITYTWMGWDALVFKQSLRLYAGSGRTKSTAIDAAIRAEAKAKAKGKR